MQNPKQSFLKTVEELKEVIWWNRSLSKWARKLPTDVLMEKVLDTKGPFLEKVDIPAQYGTPHPQAWREFANELGIDTDLQHVLQEVLFQGEDLPLYHHQGEATVLALKPRPGHEKDDILITVPTAAGKTEAFLISILQHVISERRRLHRLNQEKHQLKVLMVYPIKSLEIDQMNRIIEYLARINKRLSEQGIEPIRVGAWDGDTPNKVVTKYEEDAYNSACVDEHVRGLKCPLHPEEPLLYANSNEVKCRHCHGYNWVASTRESIVQGGVDILLTVPEALEHLLLHHKNKRVLNSEELAYIVIDEAHMWKGYSGTAFSLQLKRLRHMYRKSNPRIMMATATLANAEEFASRLTGNQVQVVRFETAFERGNYPTQSQREADFSRLMPTDAAKLFTGLMAIKWKMPREACLSQEVNLFSNKEDLDQTLEMLSLLDLIENESLQITNAGDDLAAFVERVCTLGNLHDVASSLMEVSKNQLFVKMWTRHLCLYLPELIELLGFFGGRSFVEEKELVGWLEKKGVRYEGEELLLTLFSLGRISEVLFDKYHFFLKPSSGLYFCLDCQTVHSKPECSEQSHDNVHEMFACTNCHEPVLSINNDYVLLEGLTPSECSCGAKLEDRTVDHAFLHYTPFISYLLSKVTHKLNSHKLLVFGDGRQLIEHLADLTQDLDYSLVTDRMAAFLTLQQPNIALTDWSNELKKGVNRFLRNDTPINILFGNKHRSLSASTQADLDNIRKSYADRFAKLAGDFRTRMFKPALISFTVVDGQESEAEKALMHHLIATLLIKSEYRRPGADKYFTYGVESLKNSLRKAFPQWGVLVEEKFAMMVQYLVRYLGVRLEEHKRGKKGSLKKELIWTTNDHDFFAQQLKLKVPARVTYCTNCFTGYPAQIANCPACGSEEVVTGNRLDNEGFLPTPKDAPYRLDHWATEILAPAWEMSVNNPKTLRVSELDDFERTIVLSHRSGVPQVLRSTIEEGFKKNNPNVNVVCATPTMELGIDIGNLDSIVQVGIPPTKSNYVQRTGRAGRKRSSPSVIFNIIRNENAIDGYFYENVSERFLNKSLHRLVIPEPSDDMLRLHIQAEVLRYLNFRVSAYEQCFQLVAFKEFKKIARKNVPHILDFMGGKLISLSKMIFRNFDQIIDHLQDVFEKDRDYLKQQVDTLYYGESSELVRKVLERFANLHDQFKIAGEDNIKETFIQNNSNLPMFLQNLGLFVIFRGDGNGVPIYDAKERKLENKSMHYALREGFPGDFDEKKNVPKKGALWRLEARPFEIESVYVEEVPLTKVPIRICTNVETCGNPYEVYSDDQDNCPVCGGSLMHQHVYPYRFAFGKLSRTYGTYKRIKTNPILRTIVGEFE